MTAILDHTAYPHLINTIIFHAPVASLFKLAATCKHYRDRVKPLLVKHVVAKHLPGSSEATFFVPKCLRSQERRNWVVPSHPEAIEVLDIDTRVMCNDDGRRDRKHSQLVHLGPQLASLRTLRRFGRDTVVDLYPAPPPNLRNVVTYADIFTCGAGVLIEGLPFNNLPRHIIHVRWDQFDPSLSQWFLAFSQGFRLASKLSCCGLIRPQRVTVAPGRPSVRPI